MEGRNRHYIGIRCGEAWCSIGSSLPPVPERLPDDAPYRAIPGWYDQQHLALPAADGRLTPGPWATMYPDSAYWRRMHFGMQLRKAATEQEIRSDMSDSTGMVVAHMEFEGPQSRMANYIEKYALDLVGEVGYSTVRLHGELPGAAVTFAGDGLRVHNVRFVDGTSHSVRGAVRWRWWEGDEKAWWGCEDDGCCTGPSFP